MRWLTLYLPLIVLAMTGLSACGGGGSAAPGSPPSPPPLAQNADPGGIWRGTFTSNVVNETFDALGVVTASGETRFLSIDEGSLLLGETIARTNVPFTLSLDAPESTNIALV